MVLDRILMLDGGLDVVPSGLRKLSLMEDVQKLFGLLRIQIQTIATNKLQRIPLRRIVTGGDGDASVGFEPSHRQLQAGCRTNTKINDLTSCSEQSGHNR